MESLFVLSPRFFLDDPTMFEPVDEVGGAMGVDLKRSSLALERLVNISIALSRTGEIENLFFPAPIRSVDELSPKPQRQRGRRRE